MVVKFSLAHKLTRGCHVSPDHAIDFSRADVFSDRGWVTIGLARVGTDDAFGPCGLASRLHGAYWASALDRAGPAGRSLVLGGI